MSNFKAWAKDVALRAVKTAAQAAVALVTANTAGLTHLDFATVADVAGMAAFVCVLQNLSNLKVPDPAPAPVTVRNVYQPPVISATVNPYLTTGADSVQSVASPAPAPDPTQPAAIS
jgi:hypothetical protein